jgi:hypothetical protein
MSIARGRPAPVSRVKKTNAEVVVAQIAVQLLAGEGLFRGLAEQIDSAAPTRVV